MFGRFRPLHRSVCNRNLSTNINPKNDVGNSTALGIVIGMGLSYGIWYGYILVQTKRMEMLEIYRDNDIEKLMKKLEDSEHENEILKKETAKLKESIKSGKLDT